MKNPLTKFLLLASFAGNFAETMLVPLYTGVAGKFGGSVLDAGIGYGIYCIVIGLFVTAVGRTKWFNDHTGLMVFWGFVIAGICDLSYIVCVNIYEFFIIQTVFGIAIGMLNPAWDALFSEDAQEGEHAKRWSFWQGGVNFAKGCAALAGAMIVFYIGYMWLFLAMACCDVFAIYYSFQAMKLSKRSNE